jgi:hypothetical protein
MTHSNMELKVALALLGVVLFIPLSMVLYTLFVYGTWCVLAYAGVLVTEPDLWSSAALGILFFVFRLCTVGSTE